MADGFLFSQWYVSLDILRRNSTVVAQINHWLTIIHGRLCSSVSKETWQEPDKILLLMDLHLCLIWSITTLLLPINVAKLIPRMPRLLYLQLISLFLRILSIPSHLIPQLEAIQPKSRRRALAKLIQLQALKLGAYSIKVPPPNTTKNTPLVPQACTSWQKVQWHLLLTYTGRAWWVVHQVQRGHNAKAAPPGGTWLILHHRVVSLIHLLFPSVPW